jgi:hypothetical protein
LKSFYIGSAIFFAGLIALFVYDYKKSEPIHVNPELALKVCNELFDSMKMGKYDEAYKITGKAFKLENGTQWLRLVKGIDGKFGRLKTAELISNVFFPYENTFCHDFKFKTTREKNNLTMFENIILCPNSNDELKIYGHKLVEAGTNHAIAVGLNHEYTVQEQ